MRLKFFSSRPSLGDVASAASHDIGAINAIESFFNFILFLRGVYHLSPFTRTHFLKVFKSL